jgi:hypothetical protein
MNERNPYLPELDWSDCGIDGLMTPEFMDKYLDAEACASGSARGPGIGAHILGSLQSAQRRVTAIAGRAVLKTTKNPSICQVRGHQIVARPWVNIPGHYENWFRVVGCECGKIMHLQAMHHHQDPSLSFLEPKQ